MPHNTHFGGAWLSTLAYPGRKPTLLRGPVSPSRSCWDLHVAFLRFFVEKWKVLVYYCDGFGKCPQFFGVPQGVWEGTEGRSLIPLPLRVGYVCSPASKEKSKARVAGWCECVQNVTVASLLFLDSFTELSFLRHPAHHVSVGLDGVSVSAAMSPSPQPLRGCFHAPQKSSPSFSTFVESL